MIYPSRSYIVIGFVTLLSISLLTVLRTKELDQRTQYQAYESLLPRVKGNAGSGLEGLEEIALRIAGYPNPDGTLPSEVLVNLPAPDRAIVTITSGSLMDDSIKVRQVRVELQKDQQGWSVDWAGARWKCRRDLFGSHWWKTRPCS